MFDDYPPLELLKTVETRVPCGCEMMEDIHCANGQEDMDSWPEWCYAPLAAAVCVALFEGDLGCKNPEEIMECALSLGRKTFCSGSVEKAEKGLHVGAGFGGLCA